MPNITTTRTGGVIRWDKDDWLKGLAFDQTASLDQTNTTQFGFAHSLGIDPFRSLGYLSPGVSPIDATNISAVSSTLVSIIPNGNTAYAIGDTKLYEFTINTNTVTSAVGPPAWPHPITNAVQGADVVIYNVGTVKWLFYKYGKSSGGDIGGYNIDTSDFDDDYMSTVPVDGGGGRTLDTNEFAGMIIGADDVLYIPDGNNLHAFDGQASTGTFYKNKLVLPKNSVITATVKKEDFLVLFAFTKTASGSSTNRNNCVAYFWNYVDAEPTYAFPIDSNYVSAAFYYNGTIGCFGTGRATNILPGLQNKLYLFNGSGFEAKLTLPESNPIHSGVEVSGNVIYWNSAGRVAQYGSPYVGLDKALNFISFAGGTGSGFLKNLTGSKLFISTGSSTGQGIQQLSTGYYPSATFLTSLAVPPFPSGRRGRVRQVKVQWARTASGGASIDLQMVINKGSSSAYIMQGKGTVTENGLYETYRQDNNGVSFGSLKFDSIALQGGYSSGDSVAAVPPYLQAIEVYYDYIRI